MIFLCMIKIGSRKIVSARLPYRGAEITIQGAISALLGHF